MTAIQPDRQNGDGLRAEWQDIENQKMADELELRLKAPPASHDGAEGAGPNARLMPLLDLPPAEQFDIATKLAENVGYVLSPDAYAAPPKPAPDAVRERSALQQEALAMVSRIDIGADLGPDGLDVRRRTVKVLRELGDLSSAPDGAGETVVLQAKNSEGGLWFDIDASQLEWMASHGHNVRALYPAELRSALSPSATVAAERTKIQPPSNPIYCNLDAERFCKNATNKCKDCPLFAAPPVRGDRETIARCIFKRRMKVGDQTADMYFAKYAADPTGLEHMIMAVYSAFQDADAILSLPSALVSGRDAAIEEHHKLDNDRQVFFYEQDFYVLSNFSAFSLLWEGKRFDTSEAAYHWTKFMPNEIGIAAMIREAPSAHEAFKLAERYKSVRRADWDEIKIVVMRDILRAKVNQHEYVRRKLLETGDRELIEDSWRDDFWGWGPNRDGKNMLGKLWMEVRTELRALSNHKESGTDSLYPKGNADV